jgi:hypothetical protein
VPWEYTDVLLGNIGAVPASAAFTAEIAQYSWGDTSRLVRGAVFGGLAGSGTS